MCKINCSGGCKECAPEEHGLVKFFAFAAGEFEDEELFYYALKLAKAENRTVEDVEKEFKEKLTYIKTDKHHAFETWGPQELADRLNAVKDVEVDP